MVRWLHACALSCNGGTPCTYVPYVLSWLSDHKLLMIFITLIIAVHMYVYMYLQFG